MTDIVSLQGTLYTSRNPTRRWLHTTRRDLVIDAIRTAPVGNTNRALEVGPGSGVYLPSLCERFRSVVALDVEEAHLAQLRKTVGERRNLYRRESSSLSFSTQGKHKLSNIKGFLYDIKGFPKRLSAIGGHRRGRSLSPRPSPWPVEQNMPATLAAK